MSNFRPALLEIYYDPNHNPIQVRAHGQTVLSTTITPASVSRVTDYTLTAGDKTNLNAVLAAIKAAAGL